MERKHRGKGRFSELDLLYICPPLPCPLTPQTLSVNAKALHDASSRAVVSAVNRGYNGAIVVTGQGGCDESVMVEGGADGKAKGLLLHSAIQMLHHQSRQASGVGQQTAGKDDIITEEYKSAQKIHLAFSAIMIGDDGHISDLLSLNSKTQIAITVDKDGETEFSGIKKKPIFTSEEARHVINRVVKSRERHVSAATQEPAQTFFMLQMELRGKKRRSREGSSTSSSDASSPTEDKPVTGRLIVASLSPLTERDVAKDAEHAQASVPNTAPDDRADIDDDHAGEALADQPAIPSFMNVVRLLAHQGGRLQRVPYRKAKITQVLRGALGGNCRTNIIVAVKSSASNPSHSGLLLDFASRAREVKNTAVVSRKFKAHRALMSKYRKELNIDDPPSDYEDSDGELNAGADSKGAGAVQRRQRKQRFMGPTLSSSELEGALPGQIAEKVPKKLSSDGSNVSQTVIDPFVRGHGAVEFPEEDDWDIGRPACSTPRRRTSKSNNWSGGLNRIGEAADVGLPDLPELPTQVMELSRRGSGEHVQGRSRQFLSSIDQRGDGNSAGTSGSMSSSGTEKVAAAAAAAKHTEVEAEKNAIRLEYEYKLKEMSEKNGALLAHFAVLKEHHGDANDSIDPSQPPTNGEKKSGGLDEQDESEGMWTGLVSSMASGLEPECSGASILAWFLENIQELESESDAHALGQNCMDVGAISRLDGGPSFDNAEDVQYQFTWEEQLGEQKALRHESLSDLAEGEGGTFFYSESGITMRRTSMEDNYENDYVLPEDPLLLAIATKESLPTIRALAHEYGVAAVDKLGRTAIAYCVIVDYVAACKYLSKFGADVNIPDYHGHTPLLWASYRGSVQIMEVLLKNGAFLEMTDNVGRTALHWATRLNGTECVRLLLKHTASRGGDTRYFLNLQDRREQLSALHWAVAGGKARAVRMLAKAGADAGCMDTQGRTALAYGNKYGAHNCFREIIKQAPSMIGYRDTAGRTALHLVCGPDGVVDNVAFLLKFAETDVNAPDLHLRTPLHWAATYNRVAACKLLVHGGARRDAVDTFGRRPIDLAVAKGNIEAVRALGGNAQAIEYAEEKRSSVNFGEMPEDFKKPQEEKKTMKMVKTVGVQSKSSACIIC